MEKDASTTQLRVYNQLNKDLILPKIRMPIVIDLATYV